MMMESNCEMKTSTTMKTQSTQARKEIFNDSFFIRKSIISDAVINNDNQFSIQDMSTFHSKTSNLFMPGQPRNNETAKSGTIDHQKKNSFMKTFLRKTFVLAIAVVIANLF